MVSLSLIRAQQRSLLLTRALNMFIGNNVTDFGPSKMAFDQIICSSSDEDSAKYYYLDQFTSGHARQLVRSCNSGDAAVAFKKAMKLLEDKYGNTYVRSQAYMTRLQQWPKLSCNDRLSLEELSLYLTSCLNMMTELGELGQLNSHNEIGTIVDKLPFELVKLWIVHVCKLHDRGEIVTFDYLGKIVSQQSRILLVIFHMLKRSLSR